MVKLLSVSILLLVFSTAIKAVDYQEHDGMLMNHGDGHLMDMAGGMVMGQNADTLPGGCDSISETKEITVHAGHKYAEKFPGRMFAFDTQEFNFKPCTKLTVHFVNEDKIRHQWMMHGLPKYLYPKGMFHLEISGPAKISGTLILPPGDKTYLVHCDIAQHMEKGMKAQLKVGKGDGDLPSIPGVTANVVLDDYNVSLPELISTAEAEAKTAKDLPIAVAATPTPGTATPKDDAFISGMTVIGLAIGLLLAPYLAKKFKGMSVSEIIAYIFEQIRIIVDWTVALLSSLIKQIAAKKNKILPGN
ncbi:MAG: copper oxidase [Methylovulum sp.]|nr:copper oxidase [Methylovulum sp.]